MQALQSFPEGHGEKDNSLLDKTSPAADLNHKGGNCLADLAQALLEFALIAGKMKGKNQCDMKRQQSVIAGVALS